MRMMRVRILEGREDVGIVFADVRMPGSMDEIKLAAAVRDRWPPVKLVVVSGHLVADPVCRRAQCSSGSLTAPTR